MDSNIKTITWKVIFKPHDSEEIDILFEGDMKKAQHFYEKKCCKKMKPGSVIALMNPKNSTIKSKHAKSAFFNKTKFKKFALRFTITQFLLILFVFLTLFNMNDNIFISNISFLMSIFTFFFSIFFGIICLKNRRKTVYINI